jgi:hypothetical protein
MWLALVVVNETDHMLGHVLVLLREISSSVPLGKETELLLIGVVAGICSLLLA